MAEVRLVLEAGVDDHPRPDTSRLWRAVIPPLSQVALWLWQDGTVVMKDRLPEEWEDQPDDVVGGGHDWTGQDTDWQATVLVNAGYTLTPI